MIHENKQLGLEGFRSGITLACLDKTDRYQLEKMASSQTRLSESKTFTFNDFIFWK